MKHLLFVLPVISCLLLGAAFAQPQSCHSGACTYKEDLEENEPEEPEEGTGCCDPYFRNTHRIQEPYGNETSYPSLRSGDLYDELSQ